MGTSKATMVVKACPTFVNRVLSFSAVRLVQIQDWRLGLTYRILQFLVLLWLVFIPLVTDFQSFYHSTTPDAVVSWWANQGSLYADQYKATSKPEVYCDTTRRPVEEVGTKARALEKTYGNNKFDADTSGTSNLDRTPTKSERYWFESDHVCTHMSYSEMFDKGESSIFFMTFFMQTHASDVNCPTGDNSDGICTNNYVFTRNSDNWCQCVKKTQHFAPGVEGMELGLKVSAISGDPLIDVHENDWFARFLPKRLIKRDAETGKEKLIKEYGYDQNPESAIRVWLQAADLSLDDENPKLCDSVYLNNGGKQHFRNAGLNLNLELRFKGVVETNHRGKNFYAAKSTGSYATPPD